MDPEFRCYELDLQNTAGSTQTATVSAGSTVGFKGQPFFEHVINTCSLACVC